MIYTDRKFNGVYLNEIPMSKHSKYKVIIRKPAVILMVGRRKYVAKCHPDDTFDPMIGLMMCCTKACGVNYRKLEEMLANAQVFEEEQPAPENLWVIRGVSGRHKDKFVMDYNEKTKKVKYGDIPFTFVSTERALSFCDVYNITNIEIIPLSIDKLEEVCTEPIGGLCDGN